AGSRSARAPCPKPAGGNPGFGPAGFGHGALAARDPAEASAAGPLAWVLPVRVAPLVPGPGPPRASRARHLPRHNAQPQSGSVQGAGPQARRSCGATGAADACRTGDAGDERASRSGTAHPPGGCEEAAAPAVAPPAGRGAGCAPGPFPMLDGQPLVGEPGPRAWTALLRCGHL